MSVSLKQFGSVVTRPTLAERVASGMAWAGNAWLAFSTRRALAELDDRALADLGLSRAQARFEADRPFWDMHGLTRR